jgi:2,3-bisphosphoglycerate-independent phosphoglycerate mutase
MNQDLNKTLLKPNTTKIVFLVLDGIGGLPNNSDNQTELEKANTPNLDALAEKSICGLQQPVAPGITPGSGPGHLALFGYDPMKYQVGRGVLAALGIDFKLQPTDIAARGNFCTIDKHRVVVDRRAGRISSDKNRKLCGLLQQIELPEVEVFVKTIKQYRFLLVLRGSDLSSDISTTDPQRVGVKVLQSRGGTSKAKKTAKLVNKFVKEAEHILSDEKPANMILLRGFSKKPNWPSFTDRYKLKAAAIAGYPMYRGLSRLLSMDSLKTENNINDEFETLKEHWDNYDFFYLHVKDIDSAGEDGDFNKKVRLIEEVDKQISKLISMNPDVFILTGDHSTPSIMKYHSWHPVPLIINSRYCRSDNVKKFNERDCLLGGLGPRFPATDIMQIALANSLRLEKFGA